MYYIRLSLFFSLITTAQNQFELSYYLPQNVTYSKTIPTVPKEYFGMVQISY